MPVKDVAQQFGREPKLATDEAGVLVDEVEWNKYVVIDASFKLLRGSRYQRLHCFVVARQVRVLVSQRPHQFN